MSLKWRLLIGGLKGGLQRQLQTIGSFAISLVIGLLLGAAVAALGRGASRHGATHIDDLLIVALPVIVVAMMLFSSATGVDSTIDSRKLASEPLRRSDLAAGLLGAAAIGPAGMLAVLVGSGIVVGWWPGNPLAAVPLVLAVVGWWLTLLIVTRTAANLLGAVATGRFLQLAQSIATVAALAGWLLTQLLAQDTDSWTPARWSGLADIARFTPPGQLGLAMVNTDSVGVALLHVLAGVLWLVPLLAVNVWSTTTLALSSPRPGGEGRQRRSRLRTGSLLSRLTPSGPVGAVASRTVLTRLRSPRQAVNTFTALAIGGGVFFLGPLLGESVDARIVIISGMLHFAVLFDGNNAFGYDGPPIWIEVEAGVTARELIRGKVLASLIIMTPAALALPVVLAAITGGWQWLAAGWLVAAGSVIGAAGVAVASAVYGPVAMPDTPNPLAAGDTGQGCVAGIMLGLCMLVLVVTSAPVGIAIYLASERSALLTTGAAVGAVAMGLAVLAGTSWLAAYRLDGSEAELVDRVTLAR